MSLRKNFFEALMCLLLIPSLGACAWHSDRDTRANAEVEPKTAQSDIAPSPQDGDSQVNSAIPILAEIRVNFLLDPLLTRGLYLGDRWVAPLQFENVRQHGNLGTVVARATGLDHGGRLLNRHLEVEWLAADSELISVSPTRGNRVTITMRSPGEGTLRIRYGDIFEILQLRAIYDEQNDTTQLVIARVVAEPSSAPRERSAG